MPTPETKVLQGTLDMLIHKALSLGPLHGHGIGQRIMQMSKDVLRVEDGSLYPALYRWISAEWGVSENNLRAKFYKLTRAGRKQLQIEEENWGSGSSVLSSKSCKLFERSATECSG
jgi:PadR family transcriptional regulator PadR